MGRPRIRSAFGVALLNAVIVGPLAGASFMTVLSLAHSPADALETFFFVLAGGLTWGLIITVPSGLLGGCLVAGLANCDFRYASRNAWVFVCALFGALEGWWLPWLVAGDGYFHGWASMMLFSGLVAGATSGLCAHAAARRLVS